MDMIGNAPRVKLNMEELEILAGYQGDLEEKIARLQTSYHLQQVIVTRGSGEAFIRTESEELFSDPPDRAQCTVDTVGAGDAFSSRYIHGLLDGMDIMENLQHPQ